MAENDLFLSGIGLANIQLDDPDGLRQLFEPFVVSRSDDWKVAELSFRGPGGPTHVALLNTGQAHLLFRGADRGSAFSPIWDLFFKVSKSHPLGVTCSTSTEIICSLVASGAVWEQSPTAVTYAVECADAEQMHARFIEFHELNLRNETPDWAIPPEPEPFDALADAKLDHLLKPPVDEESIDEIMSSVAHVDWDSINDAYGPAGEVPELLGLWLRDDRRHWERCETKDLYDGYGETVSERAGSMLFNATFHQGTLYDASAPMATVLIEVARVHPELEFRIEALHALGHCMANHAPAFEAAEFSKHNHSKPEVWRAARAGWQLYLSLLGSDEPVVIRRLAARLLPWIGMHQVVADRIIDELNTHSGEDPLLDSLLLLALGTTAHGDLTAESIARDLAEEGEMVGFAATVALARMGLLDRESDATLVERLELASQSQIGQLGAWHYYSANEGATDAIAKDALGRIDVRDFEIVHTMTDYYDRPRGGIADLEGSPHIYESQFSDIDDYTDIFHLTPVSPELFEIALEDWEIWLRWQDAYRKNETPHETHPALPADRARHDELEPMLEQALVVDESNFVKATAEFRRTEGRLEVRWTIVE